MSYLKRYFCRACSTGAIPGLNPHCYWMLEGCWRCFQTRASCWKPNQPGTASPGIPTALGAPGVQHSISHGQGHPWRCWPTAHRAVFWLQAPRESQGSPFAGRVCLSTISTVNRALAPQPPKITKTGNPNLISKCCSGARIIQGLKA